MALSFLLFLTALGTAQQLTLNSGVSIFQDTVYRGLPNCEAGCLWLDIASEKAVLDVLGCDQPVQNACYCNTDKLAVATAAITNCVTGECTLVDAGDVSTAVSAYTGYCSGVVAQASAAASATLGGGSQTAKTTLATINTATGVTSPGTTTVTPLSKPTSTSGGSSSSGPSAGIDTGIAFASLIVALLTLWVAWITYRWMKKRNST
jgi:hypothetical protein